MFQNIYFNRTPPVAASEMNWNMKIFFGITQSLSQQLFFRTHNSLYVWNKPNNYVCAVLKISPSR